MRILPFLAALCLLAMDKPRPDAPLPRLGMDHALFFAVSDYQDNSLDMPQPLQNARDLAGELERRFAFTTEVVPNPTLAQIRQKLYEYKGKYDNGQLPRDGQLLIFFTGHGVKEYGQGYFLPADVKQNDIFATGLPYNQWRGYIDEINCAHILVAVDACYSVTFDPNWDSRTGDPSSRFTRPGELSEANRILEMHKTMPARLFFTSDSQEDVTPGRSNFARKLLEGLANHRGGDAFLTANELFASYVSKAQPTPRAGDFGKDDPRSNFLFFYKATANTGDARADKAAWVAAQAANTLPAYRQYLRDYPNGDFRYTAEDKIALLEAEERELIAWQEAKATNTAAAFAAFLAGYPNSVYKDEAERRRAALDVPMPATVVTERPSAKGKSDAAVGGKELRKTSTPTPTTGSKGSHSAPSGAIADNMVRVAGGTYTMGCLDGRDTDCDDSEKPAHEVTVSTFYISKYEVTQAQWRAVMGNDPPELYNKGCDQCPVEKVSWDDIQDFLRKLNAQTGQDYRLPTEAEWEYAARGGNASGNYLYSGSNNIDEVAWYSSNYKAGNTHGSQKTTRPVGGKKPNELGLYDMSGNVWEWCNDWYGAYSSGAQTNPKGAEKGTLRVYRGGSWGGIPWDCRAANRNNLTPAFRYNGIGFRLARS